ncbi:MAG TPA: DEAD/DEAH box helicase [Clostridiales bacterium]|nr:DEAD/DEAH box helicase [Clostridiales bacterium]
MTLNDLHKWIISSDGLKDEIAILNRYSASNEFAYLQKSSDILNYSPDWKRLLFAASILSISQETQENETALRIALAGILYSDSQVTIDASAMILTQLSNQRSVKLAVDKEFLLDGIEGRVGIIGRLLIERRELENLVIPAKDDPICASRFQKVFWDKLNTFSWVSASAPTASGKTYLVLQWLLNEFRLKRANLAVFLAPTRALVGEIEREIQIQNTEYGIDGLRVASLPLASFGDQSKPTILVFTQERLHVFLNYAKEIPIIDILIVDEAHKIGDRQRGVLLQDAIERVSNQSSHQKITFLSPLTENPGIFIQEKPNTAIIPNDSFTVVQSLIVAEQLPRDTRQWRFKLVQGNYIDDIGSITLHARPETDIKRLSYIALAAGKSTIGTLVYANGAAEAEKIAQQIYEGLRDEEIIEDVKLNDLSDFIKKIIHNKYLLASLVHKGVAFHYGNMPTLLRTEIETLFKEGRIKFLVCTSTLIEGVNLACRTIVMRGPRKGNGNPMKPHDFWNLAGRAGRWGQDFSGNIICVDVNRPKLWPEGVPKRSRYPVRRETDNVLGKQKEMLEYLGNREAMQPSELVPEYEQVVAYLLSKQAREGSFKNSPSIKNLPDEYVTDLTVHIKSIFDRIDVPNDIINRHPGVSAIALQGMLTYFRNRNKPVEELLPSTPDSDDAHSNLIAIFYRINKSCYSAFYPQGSVPVFALITLEWMRGYSLRSIIQNRIKYLKDKNKQYQLPKLIRDTMREVEEIARFRAPKYLSAYMDVLKYHLEEIGKSSLLHEDIKYDIYLEFGVGTETLLSLIGIGLSRTSAVAINDFLANDGMSEDEVLAWLNEKRWESFDIPAIVTNEIDTLLKRKSMTLNLGSHLGS